MRRCVVIGPDVAVPRDLYEVTNDPAAIPSADIVIVNGVWFTRLRPLDGMADDEAILGYLRDRGILEVADLPRLELDDLASSPGVTRQSLHRFVRELAHSGRHPQPDRLQDFIVRRGIFV
jgi:hypothetical protein